MKKNLLYAFFGLFLSAGCSGDDSDGQINNQDELPQYDVDGSVVDPDCSAISDFTAVQQNSNLNFTINSATPALYYEVSFQEAGYEGVPGSSNSFVVSTATASKPLSTIAPISGDYVVYVRPVCSDASKGAWKGPRLVSIAPYCNTPNILGFDRTYGLNIEYYTGSTQVSNYQIQYGTQGFTLGNGVTATINANNSFNSAQLEANTSYDFYVRAFCANSVGYGDWAGPYTYYSDDYLNMCKAPSNIAYTVNDSGWGSANITFEWKGNGETMFETTVVNRNQPVSSGSISTTNYGYYMPKYTMYYSLYTNTQSDFYVRAVCKDGNKTEWVKYQIDL